MVLVVRVVFNQARACNPGCSRSVAVCLLIWFGLLELVRVEASITCELLEVFRGVANASPEPAVGWPYAILSPVAESAGLEPEKLCSFCFCEIKLVVALVGNCHH